jgi:ankyrin repeat protein
MDVLDITLDANSHTSQLFLHYSVLIALRSTFPTVGTDLNVVLVLIDAAVRANEDLTSTHNGGWTLLHYAAAMGHDTICLRLCDIYILARITCLKC